MKQRIVLAEGWQLSAPEGGWLDIPWMPQGVHEVLHAQGLIGDDFLIGEGESLKWVAERDWSYRCSFTAQPGDARCYLYFEMLDTVVTVLLNGQEIAAHKDMYLPLRVEVTGKLQAQNTLELRFTSPYTYMEQNPPLPEWEGKLPPFKMLRKPMHDFDNYLGAQPYLTPIGVFGEVCLEVVDVAELTLCDVEPMLSNGFAAGAVAVHAAATRAEGLHGQVVLYGPDGGEIGACRLDFSPEGEAQSCVLVKNPQLWWPRGYGSQPLYKVAVTLQQGQQVLDRCEKVIGFRSLRTDLDFNLEVNGVKVRMWGSNVSPFDGKTHRWNSERARNFLDLVELANMNTLRVWGEDEPHDDELYLECDRRGILIWQDFFTGYNMTPDTDELMELCAREAEYQIKRLRHHPCLFMWSGGNETIMGRDFQNPGDEVIGLSLLTEVYPGLVKQLDPGRFYLTNSPFGGTYANDPRAGDTHGYEMWWYSPGIQYPVAFSEHMRVSGPDVKSMRRWIPDADKLWPKDFVDATYPWKRQQDLMPPAWFHRVGNSLDIKSGPVHEFRDADSPEELAYKYSMAHAKTFKDGIKRSRMGRPSGQNVPRICNMHLIWKFADTWPLIYSAIVDYYHEPFIPYYEAKRSYEPVMCCFDIRDSINLWLVNDGVTDVAGTMEFGIFTPRTNQFLALHTVEAAMPAGQSGEVANLDFLGSFRTENILYARFVDAENGIDYTNIDYVEVERRLIFPEAVLTLRMDGDVLCISTDQFARCVYLAGNEDGDEFGFYFEDNYFDLLPGVEKRVRVFGRHNKGTLTAKAHYSPYVATVAWM